MNLFSEEIRVNPYPAYEKIRLYGSVFHDEHTDWRFVGRYEDVVEILKNNAVFSNAESAMEPTLQGADGERHREARAIIQRAFRPHQTLQLEPTILRISEQILSEIDVSADLEFMSSVASVLPTRVLGLMLGDTNISAERTIAHNNAIISTAVSRMRQRRFGNISGNFPSSPDQCARGEPYLREILDRAVTSPTGGWIADLLAAEYVAGRITAEQFVDIGLLLIVGATETTTSLIGMATHWLAINPPLQNRLRCDLGHIDRFINECLRFDAPVQRRPRVAMQTVKIGESVVPEGSMVIALIGSANRDPEAFPRPDLFDIDRDQHPGHLSFATGRHICPGAQLARLEAATMIRCMLRVLPPFRLANPRAPIEQPANHILRGPRRLEIAF